jgi:predicted nuclease of predicted toxin-antitoxin system
VKLLLDEMISPQVAERLNAGGGDVVAVAADPGLRGLDDRDLFANAQGAERAFVTYNVSDYEPLTREWIEAGREHHGVVFISAATIPQGDLSRLHRALERFLESFEPWPGFVHWLSESG